MIKTYGALRVQGGYKLIEFELDSDTYGITGIEIGEVNLLPVIIGQIMQRLEDTPNQQSTVQKIGTGFTTSSISTSEFRHAD